MWMPKSRAIVYALTMPRFTGLTLYADSASHPVWTLQVGSAGTRHLASFKILVMRLTVMVDKLGMKVRKVDPPFLVG